MNAVNIFRDLGFSKESNNNIVAIGRFDDFVIYTFSEQLIVAQVNSMGVRFPKQKHVIETPRSRVCYLGDFKVLNFDYFGEKELVIVYINEEGLMMPIEKNPDFERATIILFSYKTTHETYYLKEQYSFISKKIFYINTRERICGQLSHDSLPAEMILSLYPSSIMGELIELVGGRNLGDNIYQETIKVECSKYGIKYRAIIVKNLYEKKVCIKIHLFSGEDDYPYLGSFYFNSNVEFCIGFEKIRVSVAIHGRYIYVGSMNYFSCMDMFKLSKLKNISTMSNPKQVFHLLKTKKMVEAVEYSISKNIRGRLFTVYFDLKGILVGLGSIIIMDYFDLAKGKTTYKDLPEGLQKEVMILLLIIARVQREIKRRIPDDIKWRLLNSLV